MPTGKISTTKPLAGAATVGGTTDHNRLVHRELKDQHPIGAITGLKEVLDNKLDYQTTIRLIESAIKQKAKGLYYDVNHEIASVSFWYLTSEIDPVTKQGTKSSIISGPYDLGQGGGGGGRSLYRVDIDIAVKKMIFWFTDGGSIQCDLTSLFPTIIKDTETAEIEYTLINNEEKAFTASDITKITLTIPETLEQGFLNIINFKSSVGTTWEIINNSAIEIKYFYNGVQKAEKPSLLNNYFYSIGTIYNGLNIYIYIQTSY